MKTYNFEQCSDGYVDNRRLKQRCKGIIKPKKNCYYAFKYKRKQTRY